MMRSHRFLTMILLLGGTLACNTGPHSSVGFRLPPGDQARGKQVFLALECYRCHEVSGVILPRTQSQPATTVKLGGLTTRIITDGYLVTSIINPGHATAPGTRDRLAAGVVPRMPDFSERVTGRDLADLAAFLHEHYQETVRTSNPAYY